ncbi:amidohydrolase family protein [Novosphingobium sp. MW5]|nr:amidohydrolase family protein [Novosphingobium sp. MW5]
MAVSASLAATSATAARPAPIIDVHVHALSADDQGPPPLAMCTPIDPMPTWDTVKPVMGNFLDLFKKPTCKDPIWSPMTDAEVMQRTLAVMERNNVYGVVAGRFKLVSEWRKAAPSRVMPSLVPDFPLKPGLAEELKEGKASGMLGVIGELGFQYDGISVSDPALEPLWAAAESNDIPVAVHFGPGPPGMAYVPGSGYRARLSSPLLLEDVLVKHPKLRVNVMHAGFPMLDDTLALLYAHPQVYLDTGVIVYTQPRPAFYRYLQALVDAGFGKRIMFGSDQMVWPETMERAIRVIEEAPFLSKEQKRDIFYNNAARFLRLDDATIAAHHRK